MKEYDVTIETMASQDILDIRRYISGALKEPVIAKRIFESIKKAVRSLEHNPKRHAVVSEEPYASIGIRPLLVENYIAFYVVNERAKQVSVIRVLYNRREWQTIMLGM